jgi:hypothetical protein
VLRDLLVAQLVLLRQELALLVLQPRDVIRRLRDLGGESEIEEDADEHGAKAEVRMAERIQVQAVDSSLLATCTKPRVRRRRRAGACCTPAVPRRRRVNIRVDIKSCASFVT